MSFPPYSKTEFDAVIVALKKLQETEATAGRMPTMTDAQFHEWSGLQAFGDLVCQTYRNQKDAIDSTP